MIPRGWLCKASKSVRTSNPDILEASRSIVEKMLGILQSERNISGLAAPQILSHVRIIGIHLRDRKTTYIGRYARMRSIPQSALAEPLILINPKLEWSSKRSVYGFEECLSFSQGRTIKRPVSIGVSGFDWKMRCRRFLSLKLIDARVFMHELDHLNGKVISSEKHANYLCND